MDLFTHYAALDDFNSSDVSLGTPNPMRLFTQPHVLAITLDSSRLDNAPIAAHLRNDPDLWPPIEQSITEALVADRHLETETMGFRDSVPHAIDVTLTVRFFVHR